MGEYTDQDLLDDVLKVSGDWIRRSAGAICVNEGEPSSNSTSAEFVLSGVRVRIAIEVTRDVDEEE